MTADHERTEEALRTEIQQGLDDLANGRYTEHDETALADFFEDIKTRCRAHLVKRTVSR